MKDNVTFGLGSIPLIDKADDSLGGYFKQVLDGVGGKAQDFIPCVKLLIANRMGDCHSICRLKDLPIEYYQQLGFSKPRSERTLERLGKSYQFIVHNH